MILTLQAPDDGFSFMAGGGFSFQQDQDVPPGFEALPQRSMEANSQSQMPVKESQKPTKRRYWQNKIPKVDID